MQLVDDGEMLSKAVCLGSEIDGGSQKGVEKKEKRGAEGSSSFKKYLSREARRELLSSVESCYQGRHAGNSQCVLRNFIQKASSHRMYHVI